MRDGYTPPMGHRLSKIVTRTGDAGETGLTGGGRVRKTHPRVQAMGDVDELNSQLGVLLAQGTPGMAKSLREMLTRIQHELFNLGAELSMPVPSSARPENPSIRPIGATRGERARIEGPAGTALVLSSHVARLEADVETLNKKLPPLKEFVLPGGNAAAAAAHLARAICRRAERSVWALHELEPVNPDCPRYLNRLSDLLFIVARTLARAKGRKESSWRGTGRR
jgi:cob(I)alamin adenosyltransferase